MINKIRTIHLLLLDPSSNDAEHLLNLLRNNGFAVRAMQIVNEDELKSALEKQSWDLLLAKSMPGEFTVEKAWRIIEHYNRDTPVVLLSAQYSGEQVTAMLKIGIRDVVPVNEEERIRLVVARELANVEERRRRKQAETSLRETEKRCDLLLASSRDAIAYIHDGMHIYANQTYVDLFAYADADELASMPIIDMIDSGQHDSFRAFLREYSTATEEKEYRFKGIREDGENFDAVMTLSSAKYDGEECIQVLIRREAQSAELEQKLRELSATDTLTGLYNRQFLVERLTAAAVRANKQEGMSALTLLELDQFVALKSRFGIGGTQEFVRECGDYLRRRLDDNVVLARIGDDAFAALAPVTTPDAALAFGEQLVRDFAAHLFEIQGHTVKTTVSAGVMPLGENAPDPELAISNAHAALMLVKSKQGNACKMFNPGLLMAGNEADKKLLLAVQDALDSNRASLLFQPIIKMHGEAGAYYSATLRIRDDQGNLVPPDQAFPVANLGGIAAKLDRWVITEAMRVLAQYSGRDTPKVFVSLSGAALLEESLPSFIGQNLRANRLQPNALVFQIDESDAHNHLKRALVFLEGLRKVQGVSCLANFGSTEHSSALLRDLPVDFLRVDGRLAPQLVANGEAQQRLRHLLDLAKDSGQRTIVPRVEDAGCLALLYPLNVHYVQGYYLQPPMEKMEFDFSANEF